MKYIWTNHAQDRLSERKIAKNAVAKTLTHPDRKEKRKSGSIEFSKKIANRTYAVLIKDTDHGEHIIISVWVDPPFPGTRDAKKRARYWEMQQASFGRKIWLSILNLLGL